jgi:hypothetical protein
VESSSSTITFAGGFGMCNTSLWGTGLIAGSTLDI